MHITKRIFAGIIAAAMLLTAAPVTAQEEKPLLTVACLSDLHNQETLLTDTPPHIRGTITRTLTRMEEEEEKVDVILIGGDVTSDSYVSQDRVNNILLQVKAATDPLTENVLWVTGNHDYNAGEGSPRYNSAPYYDLIMKDSVGELPAQDAYFETYRDEEYLLAYHYLLDGFDFIGICSSPADMAGGSQHTNYVYTEGVLNWLEAKLAQIGTQKTVFVFGHFPIAGSNSLRADKGLLPASGDRLIGIFKGYPNLIYLYGHDHGGHDGAHIHEDTAQRVTQYDTHGDIIGGEPAVDPLLNDASVWRLTASGNGYLVQSVESGKYLGVASNLAPVSEPSVWLLGGTANGAYTLQNEAGGRYVHYSTNTLTYSHGDASTLTFYEKITDGDDVTYVEADGVRDGGEYVIAAYRTRALTNKRSPVNSERMAAIDVVRSTQSGVGAPPQGRFTVQKENGVYRFVSENGGLLGYDGNLHVQAADAYTADGATDWTVRAGSSTGTLKLRNSGKEKVDIYCDLHYGSSGWSLGNATDTVVYKESGGEWVAVTELNDGDVVFFADAGSHQALTAVSNGASGESRRLVPQEVGSGQKTVITSVTPPEPPTDEAQPSFITSFMGSMRYYSTSVDVHVGPNDSKVVQALMIYVYRDRIELQMKNYGESNAGEEILAPYVITRAITPDEPILSTLPGDVDENGAVEAADALMTLQAATDKIDLTERQTAIADVDGKDGVTAADALAILQFATGKITAFAAG